MNDNEYRAYLINTVKNGVVIVTTGATIVALYHLSHSWHALWALLLLVGGSSLKTGKAAELAALQELEESRAERGEQNTKIRGGEQQTPPSP